MSNIWRKNRRDEGGIEKTCVTWPDEGASMVGIAPTQQYIFTILIRNLEQSLDNGSGLGISVNLPNPNPDTLTDIFME